MDRRLVISSLLYKSAERLIVKGIGLVIGIILARLLAPEYFGLLAILMVFINLSQVLIQSGFSTALVQSKTADDIDYSTVLIICIPLSLVLIGILYLSAPFISHFYETEELISPLRVMSISLLFGAYNSVQVAKMQREMQFRKTMYCGVIATVLSGAIGILMAYYGYGLWALVGYQMSSSIISCVSIYIAIQWTPKLHFSPTRARDLFSYGWKMMLSAIICGLYNDLRSLIIGKRFSKTDLAYYNRGQQFPDIISNTVDNSLQSVMFPIMSKEHANNEDCCSSLNKTLSMGNFFILPIMLWLAAVARPLISILLTDKWLYAVPYMQVLCLGYATMPIVSSCLIAVKSVGRSDVYIILEIVRRSVMLLILLLSVFCYKTVMAIAIGYVISSVADVLIVSVAAFRLFRYGLVSILRNNYKTIVASVIMAVCAYASGFFCVPDYLLLLIQTAVAFVAYILVNNLICNPNWIMLKSIVGNSLRQ